MFLRGLFSVDFGVRHFTKHDLGSARIGGVATNTHYLAVVAPGSVSHKEHCTARLRAHERAETAVVMKDAGYLELADQVLHNRIRFGPITCPCQLDSLPELGASHIERRKPEKTSLRLGVCALGLDGFFERIPTRHPVRTDRIGRRSEVFLAGLNLLRLRRAICLGGGF